jgi:recombination protein RecA
VAKKKVESQAPLGAGLTAVMGNIEKQFGIGTIMRLDGASRMVVAGASTGSLSFDLALGGAGFPRGRVIELFGPESSGKTTLALTAVADIQRGGGMAAFIDLEHALDPAWCKRLGVSVQDLLVSQPESAEDALTIVDQLVECGEVRIIVLDSVAAMIPKKELEGEIGDTTVGLKARILSQSLPRLAKKAYKNDCIIVFINQIREKIGVMFGSPETTPGGRALKFFSSCRIDVRRIGQVKDGETVIGSRVKVKIVKNKVAPPFRVCEFDLMYDHGVSAEGDLIDLALEDKVLTKSGSWINHGEARLGQGREQAKRHLKDNPAVAAQLRAAVLELRTCPPGGEVA